MKNNVESAAEKREKSKARRKRKKKSSALNDPLGSYTGTPIDGEIPVQDADDL